MNLPKRRGIKGLPFSIVQFEEIDSTNSFLKDWGRQSPENGLVVVSNCQTAGRGRFAKRWESPRGEGLYLSLLMAPVDLPGAGIIPLMAGIALHKTLAETFPILQHHLDLKWPNDVLLRQKKVAGILAELENASDRTPFVVLGIGVNCNQSRFPTELPDATSLRLELGTTVDQASLLEAFLTRWHRYCSVDVISPLVEGEIRKGTTVGSDKSSCVSTIAAEPTRVISDWKARSSFWNGKTVRFVVEGETLEGTTCDVAASGALVVRLGSGAKRELFSAEIEWIRKK